MLRRPDRRLHALACSSTHGRGGRRGEGGNKRSSGAGMQAPPSHNLPTLCRTRGNHAVASARRAPPTHRARCDRTHALAPPRRHPRHAPRTASPHSKRPRGARTLHGGGSTASRPKGNPHPAADSTLRSASASHTHRRHWPRRGEGGRGGRRAGTNRGAVGGLGGAGLREGGAVLEDAPFVLRARRPALKPYW